MTGEPATDGRVPGGLVDACRRYRSIFCSLIWPEHPGYSGGEIRDYHLMRRLVDASRLEFFGLHNHPPRIAQGDDSLRRLLDGVYTPGSMPTRWAHLVANEAFDRSRITHWVQGRQRRGLPVVGARYHWDAALHVSAARAYWQRVLQERLDREQPDFLFVSPQLNPVALTLDLRRSNTRLILATYDVEAVRVRRLADSQRGLARLGLELEARRATRFERHNLRAFDGVIAVSELDKRIFVDSYGWSAERVLVAENGVDPAYFAFHERADNARPAVLFVGSLGYPPNAQAAWRLVRRIMPLVRARRPDARLWIVGCDPGRDLLAVSDGDRTLVTGAVEDVRPHLAQATVGCVPLLSGSGTKYKVLEALSAGLPVVCSPLAAEGLDVKPDEHLVVARSDENLARCVTRLLDDPLAARALAQRGRAQIASRYSWDRVLAPLGEWLDHMARIPLRREPVGAAARTWSLTMRS